MERELLRNEYLNFDQLLSIHQKTNNTVLRKVSLNKKPFSITFNNSIFLISYIQYEDTPKLQSSDKSSEQYENELQDSLKKNFNYYLIRNEKHRPNLNPKVNELIDTITKEKKISDDLTAANTKLLLDMINTINANTEQYSQKVDEMIEYFKNNQNQGFDYMEFVRGTIELIPHVITIISLFI